MGVMVVQRQRHIGGMVVEREGTIVEGGGVVVEEEIVEEGGI